MLKRNSASFSEMIFRFTDSGIISIIFSQMACSRTRSGNVPTYGSVQVRLSMTNGDSVVRALNVEQTKIAQNLQHATNADADLFMCVYIYIYMCEHVYLTP